MLKLRAYMKKLAITISILSLLTTACGEEGTPIATEEALPVVSATATYAINTQEDIVYAEGLSHESINSETATVMPLLLDVYTPVNDVTNRPAFLFIHGGAFANGSKQQQAIVDIAH